MLKKIIQILSIAVLISILSIIVIFVFNPYNYRTKIISNILNSYLENTISGYTPLDSVVDENQNDIQNQETSAEPSDKHPLLNESQEKTLESFGVNVEKLPSEITPTMQTCFIEKLGQERALEIVKGSSPSALEIIKAKDCIGQ